MAKVHIEVLRTDAGLESVNLQVHRRGDLEAVKSAMQMLSASLADVSGFSGVLREVADQHDSRVKP